MEFGYIELFSNIYSFSKYLTNLLTNILQIFKIILQIFSCRNMV